jgi:hypothetical protein
MKGRRNPLFCMDESRGQPGGQTNAEEKGGRLASTTRSFSTGVQLTKPLSLKSPNYRVAPPTGQRTRKRWPTSKSSCANGLKRRGNPVVPYLSPGAGCYPPSEQLPQTPGRQFDLTLVPPSSLERPTTKRSNSGKSRSRGSSAVRDLHDDRFLVDGVPDAWLHLRSHRRMNKSRHEGVQRQSCSHHRLHFPKKPLLRLQA